MVEIARDRVVQAPVAKVRAAASAWTSWTRATPSATAWARGAG